MASATTEQLEALQPYIAGAQADQRGEIEIYCPMHEDRKRSASLNPEKGVWCCHAGCGGGSIRQLVLNDDAWVDMNGRALLAAVPPPTATNGRQPTMKEVLTWHRRLRRDVEARRYLRRERGINDKTIRSALLGYDGRHYKIPVFSPGRRLWNVRTYNPTPSGDRSKIWNTRGMGRARLYPVRVPQGAWLGEPVLFCEGEWDTLLALQAGISAVTRTDGAGKPWHEEWTEHFVGLSVYLCHDMDAAGQRSNEIVGEALADVAQVYQCELPGKEGSGYDLSDYLLGWHPATRLRRLAKLISNATPLEEL